MTPLHPRARIIGLASSTGGPPALSKILSALPADLPAPLLIAQHAIPGFVAGLVRWLATVTPLEVMVAATGTAPLPGRAYVPPDGCDLSIDSALRLVTTHSDRLPCPSGDVLFLSMAAALGAEAAGVVLTGMGHDGTRGLAEIFQAGGATIAQDEASSVVFGMPRAAVESGAVREVLPLDDIARAIREVATGRSERRTTPPSIARAAVPMKNRS